MSLARLAIVGEPADPTGFHSVAPDIPARVSDIGDATPLGDERHLPWDERHPEGDERSALLRVIRRDQVTAE
jgi:hypothetical protein